MSVILPFGLSLGKISNVNLITKDNPIGTFGGIVAAPQAFYIPVFIIVYMHSLEFIPFTIGLLGGSHFLPYMWIYKSKAYLFVTLGTFLNSLFFGGFLVNHAFTLVPLSISIVYFLGVLLILKELKSNRI